MEEGMTRSPSHSTSLHPSPLTPDGPSNWPPSLAPVAFTQSKVPPPLHASRSTHHRVLSTSSVCSEAPCDYICNLDGPAILSRCIHPELLTLLDSELKCFSDSLPQEYYQRFVMVAEFFRDERHREVIEMCEEMLLELLQLQREQEELPFPTPTEEKHDDKRSSFSTIQPKAPAKLYRVLQSSALLTEARVFLRKCDELVQDMEQQGEWRCLKSQTQTIVLSPSVLQPSHRNTVAMPASDAGPSRPTTYECGLWYRHDTSRNLHLFKATHVMELQIVYGFGVILEVDLFTQWFPFCHTAADLGDISKFQKAAYFVVQSPWPFANRDIFFLAHATDDLHRNRRVVIEAHSVSPEEEQRMPSYIGRPEELSTPHGATSGKKCVRADFQRGGFVIDILDPTHARISILVAIDPKLPSSVPQRAINWASQMVIWKMLMDLSKRAADSKNPNSPYAQRRKDKKKLYQMLRRRFNEAIKLHFNAGEELQVPEEF